MNILVHYSEIGLKGKNRLFFEEKLIDHCLWALSTYSAKAKKFPGRIIFEMTDDAKFSDIEAKLKKVFGIAYFARAFEWQGNNMGKLAEDILLRLPKNVSQGVHTFRMSMRRVDKRYPLTSQEMNSQLGRLIKEAWGKKVQLARPDVTIYGELLSRDSLWYYFEKIKGPGGLPTSSAGSVLSLLSGGIDSPVASWQMMKRGAKIIFIHFHAYPYTNKSSQTIVRDIATLLAAWQRGALLYIVPFADIQACIIAGASPRLRLLLYRRAMVRIATMLGAKIGVHALVTGESLGQVASQTLENIGVIDEASPFPIFRPLIGNDKEETITLAKIIGTYDISIRPFEDCCSFLVPKHPETKAKREEIEKEERTLHLGKHLEKSLNETNLIQL